MAAALVAISDKGLGRKYVVAGEAVVGRHPECQIQIVDSQTSKQHARLSETTDGFTLEDLGSLNGVYVNGARIDSPVRLQPNDLIAIGDHAFIFAPDLDILPDDTGESALVVTAEGETETAGTIHRPVEGVSGDPFVSAVLSLLTTTPDAEAILPRVFDLLAEELPYDAAAMLAVTDDGIDNAFVRSSKRTVSIPRTIAALALDQRQAVLIPDAVGDTSFAHGKSVVSQNVRSVLLAPLLAGDACVGAVYLTRDVAGAYREQDLNRLLALAPVLGLALRHSQQLDALERTIVRRSEAGRVGDESCIRGASAAIQGVRALIAKAAPAPSPVLILGETGSGKELIARELHRLGQRPRGPFIPINCGAVPEHLVESEFFGHEKGAFSGADRQKPGTLELASGGTLFLDEIGELPVALQVKLLRALEEKSFYRVGGVKPVKVDFRLVAATNRDLGQMIQDGSFREDLYFRLNVLSIRNPPLRERPEDVVELARFFLAEISAELGKTFDGIDDDALTALARHRWPGNIRELKNAIERVVVLGEGPRVRAADLPPDLGTGARTSAATSTTNGTLPEQVASLERERIAEALRVARGKKVQAAKALGISRPTLDKKIKDYGIDIFGEGS
jgi:Nif-specific regulatory protein